MVGRALRVVALLLFVATCGGLFVGCSESSRRAPPLAPSVTAVGAPSISGTVIVTGSGFTGATGVSFGGVAATSLTVDSDTQISVTPPPQSGGTTVDVVVTTPAGTSAVGSGSAYTYPSTPAVTALAPVGGPLSGGTAVTITGTGLSGATAVAFGGVPAASFTAISDTQVSATSPAGSAGTVDVTVTTPVGTSAAGGAARFTFQGPPTISSVSPSSGTTAGLATVTITGSDLTGASSVTFGGAPGTGLTVVSATELRVLTPAGTAGAQDVVVTTPGGAATAMGAYTYVAAGTIHTLAGTTSGFSGDGGPATSAQLNSPVGVARDAAGNLYIADEQSHRVRVVCATSGTYLGLTMVAGNIYTLLGTGVSGSTGDGGPAGSATVNQPNSMVFDAAGNLYVSEYAGHRVRAVCNASGTYFGVAMTAGNVYTVAGNGAIGFSGDGGLAVNAQFRNSWGLAIDDAGNLLVADFGNNLVRVVAAADATRYGVIMSANRIYTIVGNGTGSSTGDGGACTAATINGPAGLAVDAAQNVYITEYVGHRVRMVGGTPGTYYGQTVVRDSIYTVAGTGAAGLSGDGGAASSAQLEAPAAVTVDGAGNLCIADFNNDRVRAVCRTDGSYYGVAMSAGEIHTIAGTTGGLSGDGGPATSAQLDAPAGVVNDGAGNLVVSEYSNHRLRRIVR